jgi:hypothetical protein
MIKSVQRKCFSFLFFFFFARALALNRSQKRKGLITYCNAPLSISIRWQYFDDNNNNELTIKLNLIVICSLWTVSIELWGFLIRFHLYFGFKLIVEHDHNKSSAKNWPFGSQKVRKTPISTPNRPLDFVFDGKNV